MMFPGSLVIITLHNRDSSKSISAAVEVPSNASALLGKQNQDSTNVLQGISLPQT